MNYELAKQLKDAGFIQRGEGLIKTEYLRGQYDNGRGSSPRYTLRYYDEQFYHPTLSELIETCGDSFGELMNGECGWWAESYTRLKDQPVMGKTPEEAVAKLWLALNAKP